MIEVYLDWNATTPPHPDVLEAMRRAADVGWANPASVHGPGRRARAFVEEAREAVGALLALDPRDVTLTSGGTEANNLALASPFAKAPPRSLVVSRIEHPSVLRAAEHLATHGVHVVWVEPLASGVVEASAIASAIDAAGRVAPVALVSLQAVNHETGVVQPVAEASRHAHAAGALLHVDAVQAVGKLPKDAWAGADLVTVAAHKIRGPKGIGAVATTPGLRLAPLLRGGSQERGVRPGTQDPVACAGFAVAATHARETEARYAALGPVRDAFEARLIAVAGEHGVLARRNGEAGRAPHVTNLSFEGWSGPELCAALDLEGVAVSSGSACSAGTADPSPVLTAMLGPGRARAAVRVSLGETTSRDALDMAILKWNQVFARSARRP